jgi:carbamoyltransferase
MIVLGLHFGHDGSVAVLRDGHLEVCIERERSTRVRHCLGVTAKEICSALDASGLAVEQVEYCAVTSTQRIEYLFPDPENLSFRVPESDSHARDMFEAHGDECIRGYIRDRSTHPYMNILTQEYISGAADMSYIQSLENLGTSARWHGECGLAELEQIDVSPLPGRDDRVAQYLPVETTVLGRQIPGFLFSHHYAHATYAFHSSPFDEAAVFTLDGSLPTTMYENGMFYYGTGNRCVPVHPHFLTCGHLYERVAFLMNLGMQAGPGKLMGLAPYGNPVFFDDRFVGNWFDGNRLEDDNPDTEVPKWPTDKRHWLLVKWLRHCMAEARKRGYDLAPLGDLSNILAPINIDLAASTQLLIEETLLKATTVQQMMLAKAGLKTSNLCMSGGIALNCPANSRIYREGPYDNVHVPPAVHDGGLSIGAALGVYHDILDWPRSGPSVSGSASAYLGVPMPETEIDAAIAAAGDAVVVERPDDITTHAAEALTEDQVIGWFQDRSEIGPRALGHRSIMARPDRSDNWTRVNRVKGRENWRPLAPAVLAEHAETYFSGCPFPSPYMLFTAHVSKAGLPAITHVDGSARIQSVNEDCGLYRIVLEKFHERTGIPIVMNTSLNGPGEPIVETPEDALNFFQRSSLDVLYLGPYVVTKPKS